MFAFAKRTATLVVAGTLALGGLVGCGPAEPTNTQELLERYSHAENYGNYHAVLDCDIEVSLFGQTMPLTAKLDLNSFNDAAHGNMTTSIMGEEAQSEIYMEKDGEQFMQYVSTTSADETMWTKSELDGGSLTSELTSQDLLKDATFAKTDNGYTLTITGDKLFEAMEVSNNEMFSMLSQLGDDSMKDELAAHDAVFTFDKDCMLTGIDYAFDYDYEYDASSTQGGGSSDDSSDSSSLPLSMSTSMTIKVSIDGYGTVKAEDVAVPDDVKKDAVDTGSLSESLTDIMGEETADTTSDTAADASADTATDASADTTSDTTADTANAA